MRAKAQGIMQCALCCSFCALALFDTCQAKAPAFESTASPILSPTLPRHEFDSSNGGVNQRGIGCDSCDMNCDTFHDEFDVPLLVEALINGTVGCSSCAGDLDGNGRLDGQDVHLFVTCVMEPISASVVVLKNGTVVPDPAYPYEMEGYNEGDLPELREFASNAGIFAGIDMNAAWKEREWDMIKAIQAWLVRNARMSAVGQNSRSDLSDRGLGNLLSLMEGGQIVAWGADDRYGNVSGVADLNPNSRFLTIAAGLHHSLALRHNGEVEAWGRNQFGQGSAPDHNGGFVAISAGANHNLALRGDGTLVAWGDNRSGQCDIPTPNSDFVAISAGIDFSVGIKSDGRVIVWGILSDEVPLNEEWQGHFIKVVAGGFHCVGLLDDGTIVGWGENGDGQCEPPEFYGSIPLLNRITDVSAGKRRSYATIDLGPGLVSWGLPLDLTQLPDERYRFVWPNRAHKALLASTASVPNFQVMEDDPIVSPTSSNQFAMAYDSDREVAVKFGGRRLTASQKLNETLDWNGNEWDRKTPSIQPPPRSDHCMAYDALRKRVIMWGQNIDSGNQERDAWEWDGRNWAGPFAASGADRPTANLGCQAIWDPMRGSAPAGRVSIFFGRNTTTVFDTAYDYDPATHSFVSRPIAGLPDGRYSFGMAYDSSRNQLVMFGGANSAHVTTNDTFEAQAGGTGITLFSHITPATTTPAPRFEHAMAYDAARRKIVMFGGRNGVNFFDETWEWDGTDWSRKAPVHTPGRLARHSMLYDPAREVVVLCGGFSPDTTLGNSNETWEWDGIDWTQKNLTTLPEGDIPDVSSTDTVYVGYATGSKFGLGLLDHVWSCGTTRQMFSGLCVAHGIPARQIDGISLGCGSDVLTEVYSTRWNKWILFWQYTGHWVENSEGVPQSFAEMRAHHDAGDYQISPSYDLVTGRRGWKATAQNGSGLVFMPDAINTAPLHPRAETEWWSASLKVNPVSPDDDHDHFDRVATTSLSRYNQPNPNSTIILMNDYTDVDQICGTHQSKAGPVSFDDDPNLTYPINNIHADVELVAEFPATVEITLTRSMVSGTGGFDHYETSLDNGKSWSPIQLELVGLNRYRWYPKGTARLMLRGVNQASVHSPDVVILYHAASP